MAWPHLIGRISADFPLAAIEGRQRSELLDLLAAPARYALHVGDNYPIDPACLM
jgi:hypothetical protein